MSSDSFSGGFGRPSGSYGGVTQAMRNAAAQGPGTVRALADRAQVGYAAARYTASRLCARGELVVLDGNARPAVLAVAEAQPEPFSGSSVSDALQALHASFWDMPPSAALHTAAVPSLEDDDPGGI